LSATDAPVGRARREQATAPPPVTAGYWRTARRRLRRDPVAVGCGVGIVLVLLAVFPGATLAAKALSHGPNALFPAAVDESLTPVGPWTRVSTSQTIEGAGDVSPEDFSSGEFGSSDPTAQAAPEDTTLFVLGADSSLGRDELLRVLYGGRVSILVALVGTLLAMTIGVLLGSAAAYVGGWLDVGVSRLIELAMAFPVLLFLILVGSTVGDQLNDLTLHGLLNQGVLVLALLIGAFTWFYPARLIRGEVLALRNREFVDAARMVGASDWRIVRGHLLPHLVPQLVVYATLLMATNITLEAGISFLGVGIELPTASWGNLLATAWGTIRSPTAEVSRTQVLLTIWPSLGIFVTVLCFNLFAEGLREALDPHGRR
jgi:ABC-type dipeptide/oligopeptide/nickel transport system permease subunit